jgi:uncharacterized protein YdeI (YjbR/CyaY-like superfamily)
VSGGGPIATFFLDGASFRAWLATHGGTAAELWMGYWKVGSGEGGLTYKPALDEALCFGWIDGVVRSIDARSYMQRWTPRKPDSHWSLVNVRRFGELDAEGRVEAPGYAAFARRRDDRTGKASFESPEMEWTADLAAALDADPAAATFFARQPPGYRRTAKHWVMSAKQEATRARRMRQLVECSARLERIPQTLPTRAPVAGRPGGPR